MKKYIYITAIASVTLFSCTKDEVKDVNKGLEIDFHTAMTRAQETTTAGLSDIWVTALGHSETNYFTDLNFTRDGEYFTSDIKYYWPSDGSTLQFYAYAPAKDALGTVNINKTTQTVTGFTPATNISDQVDFIVAIASGTKANATTGVGLVFDHVLSQIEIKALSSNTGYIYKVKGVRICNVISKGDFTFSSKNWSTDEYTDLTTTYSVEYDVPKVLTTEAQSLMVSEGDNAMLVPQQLTPWDSESDKTNTGGGAYIAVLVNITTNENAPVFPQDSESYGWLATPIDGEWEDGFKYIYNLDLKDGGLVAPDQPVDPENPEDPYKPGEEVLGGNIKFTINSSVSWSNTSGNYITVE